MTTARPVILLTGASGVMGRALIDELSPDHELICLRHRTAVDDPRVVEIAGNLAEPNVGLAADELAALCRRVSVVLHCAANTNWRARPADIVEANVGGTRQMLSVAQRAGVPFYHMSTAMVARNVARKEAPRNIEAAGVQAYVKSKSTSEALVRDSGTPAVILRPSVVIGDAATGHISAFQGIHKVIAGTYRGTIPVLPADPGSLIDCIPQDVAARAVGRLIRDGVTSGEYWLTAGTQALTLDDMVRLTLDVAQRYGPRPAPPRMVPTEMVDRLLMPLLDDVLTRSLRRQFEAFVELMLLFQANVAMSCTMPELGLAAETTHEALLAAFTRSVEYLAHQQGLVPAGAAA